MMLSMFVLTALPLASVLRFEGVAPGWPRARGATPLPGARPARRASKKLAGTPHALVADLQCAWAWDPDDAHVPARACASVEDWIESHPDTRLHLWVSAELLHTLEPAAAVVADHEPFAQARREYIRQYGECAGKWALATWHGAGTAGGCALSGIDLPALDAHARRHRVRIVSAAPWWTHVLQEARRCLPALDRSAHGQVGIVDGTQLVWVDLADGRLRQVRQRRLAEPSAAALATAVAQLRADDGGVAPVLLGRGLRRDACALDFDAVLLGRLDGMRPPQWLRPDSML